jgi:hypothetical protein
MKRKKAIRVIIISLLILVVSAGLYAFHMGYGFWWDRPDFRDDIDKIVVSEGGFILPGVEYTEITLTPESPEFQKIVRSIHSGWKYEPLVILKMPSYIVEITHSDGSKTTVGVFGNFIRIKTEDDVQIYRSLRNISELIEEELKLNNPNQSSEPTLKTPGDSVDD